MTKAKALTEAQWLSNTSPYVLLRYLQQHCVITRTVGGRRRLRLFCCACCRQIWPLLDDSGRRVVEMSEQFAQGLARKSALTLVWHQAQAVSGASMERMRRGVGDYPADHLAATVNEIKLAHSLAQAAEWTASPRFAVRSAEIVSLVTASAVVQQRGELSQEENARSYEAAAARQCGPLRDIFGNPFRSVAVDPGWLAWRGGLVTSMARKMSETGDFSDLPILADAVEEAGCASEDILVHCRQSGEHVRGCWLIDLLLGKD